MPQWSIFSVGRASAFADRHYWWLAAGVLGLALFNLTFRLGSEFVTEWDESLYAISAWETVTGGHWIGTTFLGQLDYYNSKPPLMVWLIALSFKAFGPGLVSLRIVSVASAWLTIAVLQIWTRRRLGSLTALLTGLVLSTMFGFIHVHSGRSAATDAPFTLVLVLTVVVLWAQRTQPAWRVCFGPLLAAAFLLRGLAVLMPLAVIIAAAIVLRPMPRPRVYALIGAALLFLPVGSWAIARYQLDGWKFFAPLVMYDFVARSVRPIEDHPGGPFFYLKVLQQDHFDWLFAAAVAWLAVPRRWAVLRAMVDAGRTRTSPAALLTIWAAIAFFVPTAMQTKVPWYLNTFYPVFAVAVAALLVRAIGVAERSAGRRQIVAVLASAAVALVAAESRLVWYSIHKRDLRLSGQALLLDERENLRGSQLYLEPGARAPHFVAEAIVGATVSHVERKDVEKTAKDGDYVLATAPHETSDLTLLGSNAIGTRFLYRRDVENASPVSGKAADRRSRARRGNTGQ